SSVGPIAHPVPSRGLIATSTSENGSVKGVSVPRSRPRRSYSSTAPGGPNAPCDRIRLRSELTARPLGAKRSPASTVAGPPPPPPPPWLPRAIATGAADSTANVDAPTAQTNLRTRRMDDLLESGPREWRICPPQRSVKHRAAPRVVQDRYCDVSTTLSD